LCINGCSENLIKKRETVFINFILTGMRENRGSVVILRICRGQYSKALYAGIKSQDGAYHYRPNNIKATINQFLGYTRHSRRANILSFKYLFLFQLRTDCNVAGVAD